MPIGGASGKGFVWRGLGGVGEGAGAGGWGFCGGAAVRYWKHGGLDAVMRGRRRRSPEGCSNVKDARVTVVRYSISLSNFIPSRSIAGTEALLGTSVRA